MKLTPNQIAQVSAALPGWTYRACRDSNGEWISPHAEWVFDGDTAHMLDCRPRVLKPRALRQELDQAAAAAEMIEQFAREGR